MALFARDTENRNDHTRAPVRVYGILGSDVMGRLSSRDSAIGARRLDA